MWCRTCHPRRRLRQHRLPVATSPETAALDGHPDGTGPDATVTINGKPVETRQPRPVEITLFGGVRVFVHGQEVVEGIPGSGREVLALLVVKGRAVSKEEGIDAIGDGEMSDYFHRYWGAGVRKTRATLRARPRRRRRQPDRPPRR